MIFARAAVCLSFFVAMAWAHAAPAAAEQPAAPAGNVFVEQGPLEDLLARVGRGGVPRREFEYFLGRAAAAQGVAVENISAASRRALLEHAVKLETLFQAALEGGFHGLAGPRRQLTGRFLERRVLLDPLSGENSGDASSSGAPLPEREAARRKVLLDGLERAHGPLPEDELLFRGALVLGLHRMPPVREQIIFEYVNSRGGAALDDLIRPLRERYMAKVLREDLSALGAAAFGEVWGASAPVPGFRERSPGSAEIQMVAQELLPGENTWWEAHWKPAPDAGVLKALVSGPGPGGMESGAAAGEEARRRRKQQLVYAIFGIVLLNAVVFVSRRARHLG
jgi:hypothetical protein